MTPRRYVARNHPAMPKAPQRGIRMSMDFPDVESMLAFRDTLNNGRDHELGPDLVCYKLDYFDIEEMPIGNHYILSPKTDNKMQELTREIIEVQEIKYKQKKKK
jgi:hypothetical protein